MKKIILIAVVIAALALTLAPFAGAKAWKHGHAKFNAVGKVVAVSVADTTADPTAVSTITVKVQGGSHLKVGKHVKGMKRAEMVFNVAADAKVWLLTDDGAVAKTLADVAVGDKVKARGAIAKVTDEATRVVTTTFTITNLKYLDRTPEVASTAGSSSPPAAQ